MAAVYGWFYQAGSGTDANSRKMRQDVDMEQRANLREFMISSVLFYRAMPFPIEISRADIAPQWHLLDTLDGTYSTHLVDSK